MKNTLLTFLFALLCFSAISQGTIKLTQLETGKVGSSPTRGLVGVTNTSGKQRYMTYVNVADNCINYTPTATGNLANLNNFVLKCSTDSVWYIDFEGRSMFLGKTSGGGGGGTADRDWLEIPSMAVPDSIGDAIFTYNYASVGANYKWPGAELMVNDSVGRALGVIQGNRNAFVAMYDNIDGHYTLFGQGGATGTVAASTGTTALTFYQLTGGTPQSPTFGAGSAHLTIDFANSKIQLQKYPSSRIDADPIVNFLGTNTTGQVTSHPTDSIPVSGPHGSGTLSTFQIPNESIGGDEIIDGSLLPTELSAITGSEGDVITISGGVPVWAAPSGGGGGGVSVPLNQVPYGTGTGITSDTTFRFELKPSGNGYDDKYLVIGKKAQGSGGNSDQSMMGIWFKNTANKPADNTYSGRTGYYPIYIQSQQGLKWMDTYLATWTAENQEPGVPFTSSDTIWNEGWWLGSNHVGSKDPNQPGIHDATEYYWGDGGFDQERHIGQTYVPNLNQGVFNRWGVANSGNIRRPITFEIEGVNRALTNRVNATEAHWMDRVSFLSFETSTSYANFSHDQLNRQSTISISGGLKGWHGFQMVSDSASALCRINRLSTYNGLGQTFSIYGWSRFNVADDNNNAFISHIRETGDFVFGNTTNGKTFYFQNPTSALNGGFGVTFRGDLTSPLFRNRYSFSVMNTAGNSGVMHGFRSDAGFYYVAPTDATFHFSSSFRKYSFNQNKSNAKPAQQAFLGMDSESAATLPVLGLYNTADSIRQFVFNGATPNTNITGKPGDVCYSSDGTAGTMWLKTSGTNTNTGWAQVTTGGAVTIGAFQNTATTNGLSISGSDIRLHAANYNNPGAVNTTTQEFQGAKTISLTAAGTVSNNLTLINYDNTDGAGARLRWQNGETAKADMYTEDPAGTLTNRFVTRVHNGTTLTETCDVTADANQLVTRTTGACENPVYSATATSEQITGLMHVVETPASGSTTTTITLPEIVTTAPGANQCRIGRVIELHLYNGLATTIQPGPGDAIGRDGGTATVSSITTTAGTFYIKRFRAISSNIWSEF